MELNNRIVEAVKGFFIDHNITYKKLYREKREYTKHIDGHSIRFYQLAAASVEIAKLFDNPEALSHLIRHELALRGVTYMSVIMVVTKNAKGYYSLSFYHSDQPQPLTPKYCIRRDMVKIRHNIAVYRIQALVDIPGVVTKGELGGYVDSEANLSQAGMCWIGGDAIVIGNALVSESARVAGEAHVSGSSSVKGHASVFAKAAISQGAQIYGNAVVCMNAHVCGYALVYEDARVAGCAKIYEGAHIHGSAYVAGDRRIGGDIHINERTSLC